MMIGLTEGFQVTYFGNDVNSAGTLKEANALVADLVDEGFSSGALKIVPVFATNCPRGTA